MLHTGYVIIIGIAALQNIVSARYCDGGHRCSPPKECCAQGCCYLYAPPSSPRSTPPTTDHMLNLVFINHWYFWFLVVAIVMAVLCACSLWRKRRQLCGWGSPRPHSQSGDSAGSCYAPPQYSRCSSFHHAPPPYTEVTSKPDLYPLVFSCDNTKNGVGCVGGNSNGSGSSYLMVQYFRNYIVRPAGSMSATSTVDSISSSFICSANEQNTQVPPPYSRAASPSVELVSPTLVAPPASSISSYCIQRSASQHHICSIETNDTDTDDPPHSRLPMYFARSGGGGDASGDRSVVSATSAAEPAHVHVTTMIRKGAAEDSSLSSMSGCGIVAGGHYKAHRPQTVAGSNFQKTIYMNSGICHSEGNFAKSSPSMQTDQLRQQSMDSPGTAAPNSGIRPNQRNFWVTSPTNNQIQNVYQSTNAVYKSNGSLDDADGALCLEPSSANTDNLDMNTKQELNRLRRSLETCCHLLQQQQEQQEKSHPSPGDHMTPINTDKHSREMHTHNPFTGRKYTDSIGSFVNSANGSAVSSLANIGSPASPPRATSPTDEIKELLQQIRQLRKHENTAAISQSHYPGYTAENTQPPTNHHQHQLISSMGGDRSTGQTHQDPPALQRPSSLNHSARKEFFSRSSSLAPKARYSPISTCAPSIVGKRLRSPNGGGASGSSYSSMLLLGKGRKSWISRSAPTTPGTVLPPCFLDDDSPLLNEQDEDEEPEEDEANGQ